MKKTLSVILVTLLALMLTGCNNASGITESTTQQPTKPVATTPVQTTAPTTPPTTPAPTVPTTTEPTTAPVEQSDEWEMFCLASSYATEYGGIYLKKDKSLYYIQPDFNNADSKASGFNGLGVIPMKRALTYSVGNFVGNGNGVAKYVLLYSSQSYNLQSGFYDGEGILSCGTVPVLTVRQDDLVVGYLAKEPLTLTLKKVDFYGYTIRMNFEKSGKPRIWDHNENGSSPLIYGNPSECTILDGAGKEPADLRNLEYGSVYTVSWYEGTQYNEMSMVADCSYYAYPETEELVELQGTLTKDGYCTFDFSNVKPGFYKTQGGLVIKVE